MAGDISDLQDIALMLDNLVGMLVLDCYKTQICLDYTPGEIDPRFLHIQGSVYIGCS